MRKIIFAVANLLIITSVYAQSPEKMSYQAVVRDGSNALVISSTVGMQISILQGSSSGTAVYVETQTPASNANGLVSIEIGGGTVVSGTFAGINWANGPFFIKTETDPTGGTSYSISGTSQLLSVPYALYSANGTPGTSFISENADLMPATGQLPMYDGSTYTTLLTFTVPADGSYWVSLYTETYEQTNFVNPIQSLCAIFKNGATFSQLTQNISQHYIQRPMTLVAGDVIELKCASNIGGGYALNSHGYILKVQ